MSKKYRTKGGFEAVIHTENGPDKEKPVVFSYLWDYGSDSRWCASNTYPIGHTSCTLEEVPEPKIEVGYSWEKDGRLYKVVHKSRNGLFLVVSAWPADGLERQELIFDAPWWLEYDIRQASQA